MSGMPVRRVAMAALVLTAAGCAGGQPDVRVPPPDVVAVTPPGRDPAVRTVAELPEPGVEYRALESRAGVDVVDYMLELDLRGMADSVLDARARLRVHAERALREIPLDLVGLDVREVRLRGVPAAWAYDGAVLRVRPVTPIAAGDTVEVDVRYGGTPREGLFFVADDAGAMTAFADNWPNRARWWFPSNDHPSDKATVRFAVTVPEGVEVIANGGPLGAVSTTHAGKPEPQPAAGGGWTWNWGTTAAIPSYTMVLGAARFGDVVLGEEACGQAPRAAGRCVPVSVWSLAGDSAYGVTRFGRAPEMLEYYTDLIGPFPYEKLAHVESATRFGGMENSSAIFYARAPWSAQELGEGIIAHETAHQWWGDAVTEREWSHLWLSEGFATYFDALFYQAIDGEAAFRQEMAGNRRAVLGSDASDYPVVYDTTNLYWLLNTNNYQKGAWVLHMLRGLMGDDAFFGALRDFYAANSGGTVLTDDLRAALEARHGESLGWFFDQWLHRPGYPTVDFHWRDRITESTRTLVLDVRQVQQPEWPAFRVPTEVLIRFAHGEELRRPVLLNGRTQTVEVPLPYSAGARAASIENVTLDPDGDVLMVVEQQAGAQGSG